MSNLEIVSLRQARDDWRDLWRSARDKAEELETHMPAPVDAAMKPIEFSSWVAHMKTTQKWSARRCARELGCGVNQIGIWSEKGAPTYIALACAALAYGLPAWML